MRETTREAKRTWHPPVTAMPRYREHTPSARGISHSPMPVPRLVHLREPSPPRPSFDFTRIARALWGSPSVAHSRPTL